MINLISAILSSAAAGGAAGSYTLQSRLKESAEHVSRAPTNDVMFQAPSVEICAVIAGCMVLCAIVLALMTNNKKK